MTEAERIAAAIDTLIDQKLDNFLKVRIHMDSLDAWDRSREAYCIEELTATIRKVLERSNDTD